MRKGSKVYIEGSLRTSSWEANGEKKYRTEINARELQMLDSRGSMGGGDMAPPSGMAGSAPQSFNEAPPTSGLGLDSGTTTLSDDMDIEDDIPF